MRATIQKIIILAKAERKQSITLAVLVVAALGMWARAAVKQGSQAQASQQDTASVAQTASPTASAAVEIKRYETITLEQATPLSRDLFAPRPEDFPPPVQMEQAQAEPAKSASGSDDNTTSLQGLQPQTETERVQEEARSLRLRSTVVGNESIAIIETTLAGSAARVVLRVGDPVQGFTLKEVLSRSVVLEKNGIEVTLSLPLY